MSATAHAGGLPSGDRGDPDTAVTMELPRIVTPAGAPTGSGRGEQSDSPWAPEETAADLAARHGLTPIGSQPPLDDYLRSIWERRHFISAFARSRRRSQVAGSKLGPLWEFLTPILTVATYYFIFGVLIQVSRAGITNFLAFLVTGVFVFTFTSAAMNQGARAITGNLNLVRTLHFPRATLPLATTLMLVINMGISMIILAVVVVLTGEPITLNWFLVIPALALQTLFNAGLAFGYARLQAQFPDLKMMLPFVSRIWLYTSGIFFSLEAATAKFPGFLGQILLLNPAAVYIDLVRDALMESFTVPAYTWIVAVLWAVVTLIAGFLYFYRAETRYGRG